VYRIHAYFSSAGGVEVGAPVRVAGLQVGQIEDIVMLEGQEREEGMNIIMISRLKKGVRIPRNSKAYVNTLGLLGEKYLEIYPGLGEDYLQDSDILKGVNPVPMERMAEAGYKAVGEFQELVRSLNDVVGDPEVKMQIKGIIANGEELTENLNDAVVNFNEILLKVNRGEGSIGKLFLDDELHKEVVDFVKDLKAHPWKLLRKDVSDKSPDNKKDKYPSSNFNTR
ncbi:MAG: MCE family protein, partial [Candidatus Omnitrophica bacterium]|nr:MCE family protein [Candidatus Omnitrophota bacterium]